MRLPVDRARDHIARLTLDGQLVAGPYMPYCRCGAPRHAHAGAQRGGACKATGCRIYRHDEADTLARTALEADQVTVTQAVNAWQQAAYPRPAPTGGGTGVSPSAYGECGRKLWYRHSPDSPLRHLPDTSGPAAAMGQLIHDARARLRRDMYPWMSVERSVVIPGLDARGRLDYYDPVLAKVGDDKTGGTWRDDDIAARGDADPCWWGQVHIYALGLRAAGEDVDQVEIRYLSRATGAETVFVREYDDAYAHAALGELVAVNVAIDAGQELPRGADRYPSTDDDVSKAHPLCRECPFYDHCWNVPAALAAGRSPGNYTILGVDPKPAEAIWAVSQAAEARRIKREADEAATRASSLLPGLEPGTYGPYRLRYQPHTSRAYGQAYAEQQDLIARHTETYGDTEPELLVKKITEVRVPSKRSYSPVISRAPQARTVGKPAGELATPSPGSPGGPARTPGVVE